MWQVADILWRSPELLPLAAALAAVAAAVVAWLYPPQVATVASGWRLILPGLRTAALAALAISILKPVAVRPASEQESPVLVMLIDRSASMSAKDVSRDAAESVELADSLALLPAGSRPAWPAVLRSQLERLRGLAEQAARAQSELAYARLSASNIEDAQKRTEAAAERLASAAGRLAASSEFAQAAALRQQLSALGSSQAWRGQGAWLKDLTARIETAARAAAELQQELDAMLYAGDAEVRRACQHLSGLSRLDLVRESIVRLLGSLQTPVIGFSFGTQLSQINLSDQGAAGASAQWIPGLPGSDILGAVHQIGHQAAGRPVAGVVLFSDGRQVGARSAAASALAAAGAPVFPVDVVPRVFRDLSVARLSVPAAAYAGETLSVRASIGAAGFAGHSAAVRLLVWDVSSPRQVAVGQEPLAEVRFEVPLKQSGVQHMTLEIAGADGEASGANNSAARTIKVLPGPLHVGAYAGGPSWDFQHLCNDLSHTPWIDLAHGLRSGNGKLPITPSQILDFDALLLCDVGVDCLDGAQWDAVGRLVSERGGSLLLIAGDSHALGEYAPLPLSGRLLPFAIDKPPVWRVWSGEQPYFHLAPAPGNESMPALDLGGAASWAQLPAMYRYLQMPPLKPDVRPLLLEPESGAPVLTEQTVGRGRVFFFAATETWRWRRSGDGQERFWRQLIRHASPLSDASAESADAMEVEMSDLSGDRRLLRSLADVSGGEVLRLAELGRLPEILVRRRDELTRTVERPLWDGGYLLGFVLACLSMEWALRKRLGLP